MKLKIAHKKILEYLDKHGSVNTFRLSRDLKINRRELIELIKKLTNEGLTKFKCGVVMNVSKKLVDQKISESKKLEGEKLVTKPTPSAPAIKTKIQKLENNWLKKEENLKKEIKDLQTQRKSIAQKLGKERKLLNQIQKEKKDIEKNLAEREKSISQNEEAVKKREEAISAASKRLKEDKALLDKERESIAQKINEAVESEKEKIAKTIKKLKREKKKISKATILKEDINKLGATLEDLKKKISIERVKLKKLKEKKIKPKFVAKKIEKLKAEKIKSISKIEKPMEISREPWQPAVEKYSKRPIEEKVPSVDVKERIGDKFHNLIEQEISLLKQKKNDEARNIHFKIKDMISKVIDPDQRKIIIEDWNRIKEFY